MADDMQTMTVDDAEREALVCLDAWREVVDRADRNADLSANYDHSSWDEVRQASANLYRAAHQLREARRAAEATQPEGGVE